MKKITFFIYNVYTNGGTERVLSLIANGLSSFCSVEIISFQKTADKPFYDFNDCINIIDLDINNSEPLSVSFPFIYHILKKRLKNYSTDCFICVGMRYVPITIFMQKKTAFYAWEHYSSFANKTFSLGSLGRIMSTRKADKIIVLTKKDKENYINKYHIKNDKIIQIYNPNESKCTSKCYNLKSKKIITAGRFTNVKGYDYLIKIAKKVFSSHPDWIWDIYGDGPLYNDISKMISQNCLQNNVFLKGVRANLIDLYKDYSFYVLTSRNEGFPMVIIESKNARLPVVSFDCPVGPSELILDGNNGFLVDCFDTDKMAERINYLIENSDIRLEFSNNSIINLDKLDFDSIIKKWVQLLTL